MSILEDFKAQLGTPELRKLTDYLHDLAMEYPQVELKKKFNVPFYYGKTWMYYLTALKKSNKIVAIEFCFVRGRELASMELLDFKERTMVGGISYSNKNDVDPSILKLLIQEAVELDEVKPFTVDKRKK